MARSGGARPCLSRERQLARNRDDDDADQMIQSQGRDLPEGAATSVNRRRSWLRAPRCSTIPVPGKLTVFRTPRFPTVNLGALGPKEVESPDLLRLTVTPGGDP